MNEIETQVLHIVGEVLGLPLSELNVDDNLYYKSEMDSLKSLELVDRINLCFSIDLYADPNGHLTLISIRTISAAIARIRAVSQSVPGLTDSKGVH